MTTIPAPYPYFTDASGNALEAGKIYIGTAGLDPRTNPIAVYQDEALTIAWAQPIRTVGGYPVYIGAPSNIQTAALEFSLIVATANGEVVFRDLNVSALSSSNVTFVQPGASAATRTVQAKLREIVSLDDYILATDPVISGYPDASLAFARAAAVSTLIVGTPGSIYYVKDVVLNGRQFDGRNCVLRDAPGSRWGIKLNGYGSALRNFYFQDQGTYVATTTLASGMTGGSSTAVVTSAAGIEIGEVFFVELDANELRWQTFVTNVVGNTVTIRDAIPSAAAAGKEVNALFAAVMVGEADRWAIENVNVINARGGLLTKPETSSVVSNRGTVVNFQTDGAWYYGWIKAENCAGIKAFDTKLWCGRVETFNYTGSGIAGPYSFGKRVFLLRDVTVTVNGVPQVYLTDWNYASQTSIQFLAGRFPAAGAAIVISHFRDGYRGFVDDQRNTAIISGGSLFNGLEVLDAFVGVSCLDSELTEFSSMISDGCQYVALQLSSCTPTLVFSSDCFLGFSGASLRLFNSNPKAFVSLYTNRVPLAEQWLGALDDNILVDATSNLRISASGWSGEYQNAVTAGGKFAIVGGTAFAGRNVANVAGGSTVYLAEYGSSANLGDTLFRTPRDGTLKAVRVDTDVAPGAGQTYTYDVLVSGVSQGTVTISGAAAFSATGVLNTFVGQGTQINLRLITSATAAAGARHYMQAVMI